MTVPVGLFGQDAPVGSPPVIDVDRGARVVASAPIAAPIGERDPRTALLRRHLVETVGRTVSGALRAIPPTERARAHVVLAAHGYAMLAVREFVGHRRDEDVRLRAVHSVALESSRLLTTVSDQDEPHAGWAGRAVILTSADGGDQAMRTAMAALAAGTAPCAVAAQVRIEPDDSGSAVLFAEAVPIVRIPCSP